MIVFNAEKALLDWRTCQLVGCGRRMIRFIEDNAKCRHLKKWPVKGLSERCLWRHFALAKATTLAGRGTTTMYVVSGHTVCTFSTALTYFSTFSAYWFLVVCFCFLFHLSRHHVLCRTHHTKIELNAGRYHASRQGQYIPKSDNLEFFHLRLVDNVQCWLFWEVNDVMLYLILFSNTHRTLEIRKNILSTKTCLHSVRYYWSAMEFFGKQTIRTEHRRLTQNELQVCFSYKILYSEKEKDSHPI